MAELLAQATPAAADLLQELAETMTAKEMRKAARRALYLLSQRGIVPHSVPRALTASSSSRTNPSETGRSSLVESKISGSGQFTRLSYGGSLNKSERAEQHATRVYASVFDGAGNRVLFLTWPDPDGGSPTFSQLLINDEVGVKDIATARLSRRTLAARLEEFSEQRETGIAVNEIELDYGRFLLHQARSLNQRHGQRTPPGFLDILSLIGETQENYTNSPVWNVISPQEVRKDAELPHDPAALFRLIWFEPWFMDVEDVTPWLQPVLDISILLQYVSVSEALQRRKLDKIAKEAAVSLFNAETRARYVSRLEESADILRRCEHEKEARQALFHAMNLRDAKTPAKSPFAVLLVQRTLQAAVEMTRA